MIYKDIIYYIRYGLLVAVSTVLVVVFSGIPVVDAGAAMTWNDCVRMAAERNPDLRAARETYHASEHTAKAAFGGYYPQVSLDLTGSKGNNYTLSTLSGNGVPFGNNVTASLTATQNLFKGFGDRALVAQGRADREASSSAIDVTRAEVSYSLKSAFAGLLYAQDADGLARRIIARREENRQMVELRFESGVENRGSAMMAAALVGQARYERTVARNAIRVSQEQLAAAMGLDDAEGIAIKGPLPTAAPKEEPDFRALAYRHPERHQAIAEEESQRAGVSIAKSRFFPSVDVIGAVSTQGEGWAPDTGRNSIGVSVSLPVFSGGTDYYNYKSAVASYGASAYDRLSTEQGLMPALKQAWARYVEAVEKLKVDQAFLAAAEVRAEIARNKYNNGLMSFENWDIVENDLITKQRTALASERDRAVAEAVWELAQGRGVIL